MEKLGKKEIVKEKVDPDIAKMDPVEVARVKMAEADGKVGSTKA